MKSHGLIFSVSHIYLFRNFGAHKIASWLRSHGWDIEVADFAGNWSDEQLLEFCKSRINDNTVFVGFSDIWGTSYLTNHAFSQTYLKLKQWIRANYPSVKIIVGSQEITTSPLEADFYIHGYAEYAILAVLKYINGSDKKLKFTLYRNGKLVMGSDYPAIYMHDLTQHYEARDFIQPNEQLGLEMSRGCKFNCDYCSYLPLGVRGDNFRDTQNYIDNLKSLYDNWGVTTFFSADSTTNVSPEKISIFAEKTAKLNFKPYIAGFLRADLLIHHKHLWPEYIAMGLIGHHYGIETLNHPSAKAMGKGMKTDKLKEGLLDVYDYFKKHTDDYYRSAATFICGLPYDTIQDFQDSLDWVHQNLPVCTTGSYPLMIPRPEENDPLRMSKIGKDFEKYGYEYNYHSDTVYLNWYNKNTGLSFEQSVNYIASMEIPESHLTPWELGMFMQMYKMDLSQVKDLKIKKKSLSMEFDFTLFEADYKQVIDTYIHRKLSL